MREEGSVYRSSCNLFPYEAGEDLAEAMYKYLTEAQADAICQKLQAQLDSSIKPLKVKFGGTTK